MESDVEFRVAKSALNGHEHGGFIVRVYFDGQLQDSRATPPELLTLFPAPDQIAPSPSVAP
jgi:hypothetical protein